MQRLDPDTEAFKRILNVGVPKDDDGADDGDNEVSAPLSVVGVAAATTTSESASPPPPPATDEEGDKSGKIKFHRPSIIKALFPKDKDKAPQDNAAP